MKINQMIWQRVTDETQGGEGDYFRLDGGKGLPEMLTFELRPAWQDAAGMPRPAEGIQGRHKGKDKDLRCKWAWLV